MPKTTGRKVKSMAIADNKKRIAITLTEEQERQFSEVAEEMGITKSILMQIATMQYVNAYKQSKSILTGTVKDALQKLIDESSKNGK